MKKSYDVIYIYIFDEKKPRGKYESKCRYLPVRYFSRMSLIIHISTCKVNQSIDSKVNHLF